MEHKSNKMQDEATKRTAADALFSKIYSAKLGYFTDDYSKLFNKKERKMMPIINRGTWTRVFSVRSLINNFINKFKDESEIQILSLGAGLDTNFFYFQENIESFKNANIKYYEVDFQDIWIQKISVIKENSNLETLIFNDQAPSYSSEDAIISDRYRLISWDIRETDLLSDKLVQAGISQIAPTLVLTEWVLWYMDNSDSWKVLSFLTTFFEQNVAVVNFEMIRPHDPFGQTMLSNLEARGWLLLGLKDVPDEDAQVTRMIDWGFKYASWESMLKVHNHELDETERHRIEGLEIFDEFEEWDLLQTHYCIAIGSKFVDDSQLTF